MKKIRKFIKNNAKVLVAFILGIIVSGTTVYAATILAANQVGYDNASSGISATNVQDALDELYTKAQNMVPIDPNTFNTNTAKTVYASSKGVCIKRNNKLNCFKINNWSEEQNHIQQVFSDISCDVTSSRVSCGDSDFHCDVFSDGHVYCRDDSGGSSCVGCRASDFGCYVDSSGDVGCGGGGTLERCSVSGDGSVLCR